jgi:hypothetical protein
MDVWAYILDDGITVAATMDINSVPQGVQPTKFTVENLGKTNFKVENGQIVIDEDKAVLLARGKKTQQLAGRCGQAIVAGFKSGNFTYGSQTTDQLNIHTAAKYGGYLWRLDSSNNWSFVNYTAQEGQKIEQDMIAFIQSQQTIYANLVSEIKSSSNISYINSITWPTPPQ